MKKSVNKLKILDLNKRFHDDVEYKSYDKRMGLHYTPQAVMCTISELENVLGQKLPDSLGTVVDLGCGTGNLAIKIGLSRKVEQLVGIDISEKMLDIAKCTARKVKVPLRTICSDMEILPFEDSSVDLIVGCAFLHHLPDPIKLFDEIARVLKPNAKCVIIGEPSQYGARLIDLVKSPLVLLLKFKRFFLPSSKPVWEHDLIDVHSFSMEDIDRFSLKHFKDLKIVSQGFLEPIIDQSILVVFLLLFGQFRWAQKFSSVTRKGCRLLDKSFFNLILPASLLVSLKFSLTKKRIPTSRVMYE